jgi:regulator of sirC expression with transglutaminase-like and TPR domain
LAKDIPPTGPLAASWADELAPGGDDSLMALGDRAKLLDQQAAQLRKLALAVHQRRVLRELQRVLDEPDFELFHAALLIARLDNDELDVEAYRGEFERLAGELKSGLPAEADEAAKLKSLNEFLFAANGFHGSRADYYNRSNSYVNEVLDDREGLPITLSLIYIELARKIGLKVVGVGLPGHFVVKHVPAKGDEQLIDVFEAGAPLSREQAEAKVRGAAGRAPIDDDLKPVDGRAILVRMLHNLQGIAGRSEDVPAMLRYLDAILIVSPDSPEDRMFRAFFRYRSGLGEEALEDLNWLIEHEPEGIDLERVRELRSVIERSVER